LNMVEISKKERAYRAALYEVDGIGPARMRVLLKYYGSAEKVWQASNEELLKIGMPAEAVKLLTVQRKKIDPEQHLQALAKLGIRVLTDGDEEYPRLLEQIDNSPALLFVRGGFKPKDELALAVVGTRRSTPYGRGVTERFVEQLVEAGLTIVSGLARGIDGIAHRAALEFGGRTIAVLGGGVDRVYPPEHIRLADEITKNGALISEFAPGKLPVPGNFPARNRIISGLSLGVLVVEGASKSGTKITARLAVEQGREVFAVPGPITSEKSEAPADLIKLGAKPVTSARDILEELKIDKRQAGVDEFVRVSHEDLTKEEQEIIEVLKDGQKHVDEIAKSVKTNVALVSATLTMLELKGAVKHLGGMVYVGSMIND
jgi:DNA processing protein